MSAFEFILLVLAIWHAVEVWNHGSIFADLRASLQASDGWLSELTGCMFCLSLHVGFWLALWMLLTPGGLWYLPVYALAATRCANLANDLAHGWTRIHAESISTYEERDRE